tara:strand:+ start:598311 stop:599435 length:1125 start_codon:yes stop_codon:yes gene_type:complete
VLNYSYAQNVALTSKAEISVITVAPGDELVDSFGHSAFRVKDEALGLDLVYNYGTYNFDTPNFYGKFAQGKLLYDLGLSRFQNFLKYYASQNRSVVGQVLNLSLVEKRRFFDFLQNNAKPENKSYLYDFFFDNCATRLRDVSDDILKDKLQLGYTFTGEENQTFRDLIHNHLDYQPWGKFGIDLALGSVIDRKATPQEYLFLPEYVYKSFEKGILDSEPLISETKTLYSAKPKEKKKTFLTPFLLFSVLAIIALWVTFNDYRHKKRSKWLDFILFFITGIIGLLVLLLWFATDHTATATNFNFLWAFFPNLFVGFLLLKKQTRMWIKKYVLLLLGLLLITILLWLLKIQIFSIAIVPILMTLATRYLFLYKKLI